MRMAHVKLTVAAYAYHSLKDIRSLKPAADERRKPSVTRDNPGDNCLQRCLLALAHDSLFAAHERQLHRRRETITRRRTTRRETKDKKFNMLNFCLQRLRQFPRQTPALETVCRFAVVGRHTGLQNRKILSPPLSPALSLLFCLPSAAGLRSTISIDSGFQPLERPSMLGHVVIFCGMRDRSKITQKNSCSAYGTDKFVFG